MLTQSSYLICASPRSGSGLLAGVLRSSGIAGRPEEYFWRGDMPHWREVWGVRTDADYFRAALDAGSTPNGVFGARVMWAYLDDVIELASRASGAPSRAIQAAFPHLRPSCSDGATTSPRRCRGRRPSKPVSGTRGTHANASAPRRSMPTSSTGYWQRSRKLSEAGRRL